MEDLATAFFNLFVGLDRAHGRYITGKAGQGGKVQGSAATIKGPPTVELWRKHLEGQQGLGVIPILADGTCRWATIDIDQFNINHVELHAKVDELGLPLVVCRSKSGGAHLFLFLRPGANAKIVTDVLKDWAAALGYAGVEIFPKQTQLSSADDVGNWLNMPYMSGTRTTRYALDIQGTAYKPEEFLALAANKMISQEELTAIKLPELADQSDDGFFEDGPPCLCTLSQRGFAEGTRNNALFNIAVFLRKRDGDDWAQHLERYNAEFMKPPLGQSELKAIIKSVNKRKYNYKCKDQPIVSVCNRNLCHERLYGVGQDGPSNPGVVFGQLEKLETKPPTWRWTVNGKRLELSTEDLMNQHRFHKRVMEELNLLPFFLKPDSWTKLLREHLAKATNITVPDDATPAGQWMLHLERFCTGRVRASTKDEILLGRPYTDKAAQRTFFRSHDLFEFFNRNHVNGVTERAVYSWLESISVERGEWTIKGKRIRWWSVPAFPEQTTEFDAPQSPDKREY